MHAECTIRAAKAGVHVLCEKPMALTVNECQRMIGACNKHRVKLMIAYRLHFEEINLNAIDLIRKGFFKSGQTVLFWHTGGQPALFAQNYERAILQ